MNNLLVPPLKKYRTFIIRYNDFTANLHQTLLENLRKQKRKNLTTPLGRKPPTPKRWRSGWLGVQEKYNVIEK